MKSMIKQEALNKPILIIMNQKIVHIVSKKHILSHVLETIREISSSNLKVNV
jgi:hypothetical protein